jgi:hypothetical protein
MKAAYHEEVLDGEDEVSGDEANLMIGLGHGPVKSRICRS